MGGAPGADGGGGDGEGGVGGDPEPRGRLDASAATTLRLGGTWLAWLSETNGDSVATRFTQSLSWRRASAGALSDGAIDVPINRDENGDPISSEILFVWTGTSAMGTGVSPCCEDWTTTSSGAAKGMTDATDAKWSFNTGMNCSELAHLYCFEQ